MIDSPTCDGVSSLEYHTGTSTLLGVALQAGVNKLVSINSSNGALTPIGTGLTGLPSVSAGVSALDAPNNRYYVSAGGRLVTIDTTDGSFTSVSYPGVTVLVAPPLWQSDNEAVAPITQSGNATGMGTGTTLITASGGNVSGSTLLTVQGTLDLSVTKADATDPVNINALVSYTVSVTNNDLTYNAGGVTLTDTLPAGSAFLSATPSQGSCNEVSLTVTCSLGIIGPLTTVNIGIDIAAPSTPGLISNTATVSAANNADPVAANDTAVEQTTVQSTKVWANAVIGNWSVGANWVGGVAPANGDNVVISASGNYTVTLDVDAQVNSLTLGDTTGTQTLSVGAGRTLTINSASTVTTVGALALAGTLTGAGDLTVNGQMTWTGGTMSGTGTATLEPGVTLTLTGTPTRTLNRTLANAGIIDVQSNATIGGSGALTNSGTFRKSVATGTTTINPVFSNNGTVEVQTGILSLILKTAVGSCIHWQTFLFFTAISA